MRGPHESVDPHIELTTWPGWSGSAAPKFPRDFDVRSNKGGREGCIKLRLETTWSE